jgi:Putative adhesin
MIRSTFRLIPALLVLALTASACDVNIGEHGLSMGVVAGKAQNEWTRTYTLSAGGQLEIVNVNGTIDASPASGGQVEVRAERIAKASNDEAAQELLKKIEIAETASADRVRLETKVPRQNFGRSGHEVRYFVKVPKGLAVQFETVNGAVRLQNLDGRVVASTTNGGVRGSGLRGEVKASTTNGGVEITMASVTGEIELETTNGGIRLQLPRDVKANLEARCTNGGIGVEEGWDAFETTEKSRRRVSAMLNGGGPRVSAETTNGGIRISATRSNAETN